MERWAVVAKKAKRQGEQRAGEMLTPEQRRIRSVWAQRHPNKAAQERALRVERAAMVAEVGHKITGTLETHYHARRVRQGAIARLYASGRLSVHEMGWAGEIRAVAERIGRDVAVSTASLETRVDTSRHIVAASMNWLRCLPML